MTLASVTLLVRIKGLARVSCSSARSCKTGREIESSRSEKIKNKTLTGEVERIGLKERRRKINKNHSALRGKGQSDQP